MRDGEGPSSMFRGALLKRHDRIDLEQMLTYD